MDENGETLRRRHNPRVFALTPHEPSVLCIEYNVHLIFFEIPRADSEISTLTSARCIL